ncbi:MAG: hypothetical protein ACTSWY_10490 [Promethearchaeota archaeon]
MKVRVCLKCREFISIHENSYLGNKRIKLFESRHAMHPLTTDIYDPEKFANYKNVNEVIDELVSL